MAAPAGCRRRRRSWVWSVPCDRGAGRRNPPTKGPDTFSSPYPRVSPPDCRFLNNSGRNTEFVAVSCPFLRYYPYSLPLLLGHLVLCGCYPRFREQRGGNPGNVPSTPEEAPSHVQSTAADALQFVAPERLPVPRQRAR